MWEKHFSSRFKSFGNLESDSALQRCKKQKESENVKIFDLTISNPTQVGLGFPEEVIRHGFSQNQFGMYEAHAKGNPTLREQIASIYTSRGIKTDSELVYLTASTAEAFSVLFKCLTDPGDEVLTPSPGYPLFSHLTALEGIGEAHYLLRHDSSQNEWIYEVESILKCISTKTKLILLVSPNNPTGSIISKEFWEDWEKTGIQIPIILDEVFYESAVNKPYIPNKPNFPILICNGISKALALPQMKLAWVILNGPENFNQQLGLHLELVLDSYLSVNTPIQTALPDFLPWKDFVNQRIQSRILRNQTSLNALFYKVPKLKILPSKNSWYGLVRIESEKKDESTALLLLSETNVYVHPGSWYGFPTYDNIFVLSMISDTEVFEKAIQEIVHFLR